MKAGRLLLPCLDNVGSLLVERDTHSNRTSAAREEPNPLLSLEAPDLNATPARDQNAPPNEKEMHDRVSLGDYTGALDIAERLLLVDRSNERVLACAAKCR